MKTTFRLKNNSATPTKKQVVLILAVLLLGLTLFSLGGEKANSSFALLWRGENNVERGLSNLTGFFRTKEALIKENEALKEKLRAFDALTVYTRVLESAEEELLSHYGRGPNLPSIAAGVLAHPPETPYDILVIDAGRVHGVEVGDRVSIPAGGALGKVVEVGEKISKVALYSGNGERTPAVLERKNVPITLLGEGGGVFKLLVPNDVAIEVGDKILLPGLRAELVGVVAEVEFSPTDAEKRVIVSAVANVSGIRFVIVY